jgi:hypothetical protein
MTYHVTCPHCEAEHPLLWGGSKVDHGFKWDGSDPATVRHVCPHCRGSITQADYLRIWEAGAAWVSSCGDYRYGHDQVWRNAQGDKRSAPRHVAFHVDGPARSANGPTSCEFLRPAPARRARRAAGRLCERNAGRVLGRIAGE